MKSKFTSVVFHWLSPDQFKFRFLGRLYYLLCATPSVAAAYVLLMKNKPSFEGSIAFFLIGQLCPFLVNFASPVLAVPGLVGFFTAKAAQCPLFLASLAAVWPFLFWDCVYTYGNWQLNPLYITQERVESPDGSANFQIARFDRRAMETVRGLRAYTNDIIYQSVYFDGLEYCFSKSGHVYAMAGAEHHDPSIFVRGWKWSGKPDQFPFYKYSKACIYCCPQEERFVPGSL